MKNKLFAFLLAFSLMLLPIFSAGAQLSYVTDEAGLLYADEVGKLNDICYSIEEEYGCAVYMITVPDYTDLGYSYDIYETAYSIYHNYNLGSGSGRDGILLLLSMEDRDFAFFVYGDKASYAFDDYGQMCLEDEFLPLLSQNDWYGGLNAYAYTCLSYLDLAQKGEPVRASNGPIIVIAVLVSFLIAFIAVSIMKAGMKNVYQKTEANNYVSGNLNLTNTQDVFAYMTQTRQKIESQSSGSSSSRSGGGGSGRAGKF